MARKGKDLKETADFGGGVGAEDRRARWKTR